MQVGREIFVSYLSNQGYFKKILFQSIIYKKYCTRIP